MRAGYELTASIDNMHGSVTTRRLVTPFSVFHPKLVRRGSFSFYFPLATSIVVSIILTLILAFFRR